MYLFLSICSFTLLVIIIVDQAGRIWESSTVGNKNNGIIMGTSTFFKMNCRLGKGGCMVCPTLMTAREEDVGHAALCPTYQSTNLLYLQKIHCVLKQVLLQLEGRHDQLLPDIDSFIASRISLVVALVSIPGTSKGDFGLFLKIIEKASPPLRFITTSSVRAKLSTSESRCLASE